jgi:hypothetical protein
LRIQYGQKQTLWAPQALKAPPNPQKGGGDTRNKGKNEEGKVAKLCRYKKSCLFKVDSLHILG